MGVTVCLWIIIGLYVLIFLAIVFSDDKPARRTTAGRIGSVIITVFVIVTCYNAIQIISKTQ